MQANQTVNISGDASALNAVLAKLSQALNLSAESVQALLRLLDDPSQVVRVDVDHLPANASELRVSLQPTDRFLELVSALLAGNVDLD